MYEHGVRSGTTTSRAENDRTNKKKKLLRGASDKQGY